MQEETVQPQNPGEPEPGPAANRSLEELLAETQAKLEQQREQMLRALAETDNVRKRLQTEAANAQKYALERFAKELMPVIDSLEAAEKNPDPAGIEVIVRQLKGALDKVAMHEINPARGERFDPHVHEAMAAVEDPLAEPNTVLSVLQKGYLLHDRVLRPALVTVAKAVEKPAATPTSDSDLD